ncbi:MAG: ABC transporter ATP-binding protein [Caldisphaeraceae archaeon]|nr:ABC transporter ATP-binding protein [Caldisphaeraceae archaeon]
MKTSEDAVSLNGVVKLYGNFVALRGISFRIPDGGKYALLGPNGAGKSTTLKLIAGLLKPDKGTVRVYGYDPANDLETKKIIGYLPEDATPYRNLSVRENLEYIAALRGIDDAADRALEIMDALKLRDYERAKVAKLSRGNIQKLALALAIIHRPRLLLLDEPLNYLDIPTQEEVISMLSKIGNSMLVSTHIMAVAGRLTDNIIMISRGTLIWQGTFAKLKEMSNEGEPIEKVVARLMTDGQVV